MKILTFIFVFTISILLSAQSVFAAPITNGDAEWTSAFGNWTGASNAVSTNRITNGDSQWNSAFGNWSGVNSNTGNNGSTTSRITNGDSQWTSAFGNWTGINTSGNTSSTSATRSSSSVSNGDTEWTSAFGSWADTASASEQLAYNASGYATTLQTSEMASAGTVVGEAQGIGTFRVAPTSGVNAWTPAVFAGLLVLGFAVLRNRKALFN